jgi:hypothetical protein
MKAKLIKTENGYGLEDVGIIAFYSSKRPVHKHYKLSKQNCDEIFGVVDVEKLINEADTAHLNQYTSDSHELMFDEGFKMGFNKAMELNKDKRFTLDDMHKMFYLGSLLQTDLKSGKLEYKPKGEVFNDYIQPLQQPKEIEVEIKMEPCFYDDSLGGFSTSYTEDKPKEQPKLDSDGCLILKKV